MLGLSALASSSSTERYKRLFPSRFVPAFNRPRNPAKFGPGTFKKKLLKLDGIAVCRGVQARRFGWVGLIDFGGERRLPKSEREVSDAVEGEHFAVDVPPGRDLHCGDQRGRFVRGKIELDDRAGDVPRHVLAADQI